MSCAPSCPALQLLADALADPDLGAESGADPAHPPVATLCPDQQSTVLLVSSPMWLKPGDGPGDLIGSQLMQVCAVAKPQSQSLAIAVHLQTVDMYCLLKTSAHIHVSQDWVSAEAKRKCVPCILYIGDLERDFRQKS